MRVLILLLLVLSLGFAEVGETRIGFEVSPTEDYKELRSYNFKFKQKGTLNDFVGNIKVDYKTWDNSEEDYTRIKINPTIVWNYLYWENVTHLLNGSREFDRSINMIGLNYKFSSYLTARVGYSNIDDSREDDTKEGLVLYGTGKLLNTSKLSIGYETYYFQYQEPYRNDNWMTSLEVQLKYHLNKDWDIYCYSVNGFTKEESESRLDFGIYYYF